MPRHDKDPTRRVRLECGHVRRAMRITKGPYYCLDCDGLIELKEVLPSQWGDASVGPRTPAGFRKLKVG